MVKPRIAFWCCYRESLLGGTIYKKLRFKKKNKKKTLSGLRKFLELKKIFQVPAKKFFLVRQMLLTDAIAPDIAGEASLEFSRLFF